LEELAEESLSVGLALGHAGSDAIDEGLEIAVDIVPS